MKINLGVLRLTIAAVCVALLPVAVHGEFNGLWQEFLSPPDSARTKLWWFHGETPATFSGVEADLTEFRDKGIGGVVFYDQVHGSGEGAPEAMSPIWWQILKHAALKAKHLGLSFEVAASNGYVAGGPWITPDLAMRKTLCTDTLVTIPPAGGVASIALPAKADYSYIASVYFPDTTHMSDIPCSLGPVVLNPSGRDTLLIDVGSVQQLCGISYDVTPRGKGSTSSMNVPVKPAPLHAGALYEPLPPLGVLEISTDGYFWRQVAPLSGVDGAIGHKSSRRSISFPAASGRYVRILLQNAPLKLSPSKPLTVKNLRLHRRDIINNVEVKSGLRTEVEYPSATGGDFGAINPDNITPVATGCLDGDTLRIPLGGGTWRIVMLGHIPTGARTKHGRRNLLGLEADVMQRRAAEEHFLHYFKPVCDTLASIGAKPLGMCMDSHEAGIQNWTEGFDTIFCHSRGYDLTPLIPAFAGYIVESRERSEQFLADFRTTVAETIAKNFYGTLDSLCRKEGVNFTSQAMLNIDVDNILSRGSVQTPQGEFWAYQTNGNYDVLDAASSAHIYGHPIASAEAFTDTPYSTPWADLLPLANLAWCSGINEFAVCASSYQPWDDHPFDDSASAHPYVFHRHNPQWTGSRKFWDYQARCTNLMRKGVPVVDLCVYLGGDLPAKTFAFRLPDMPAGYKFDVCTSDALLNRFFADGKGGILVDGGMRYRAIVVPARIRLSEEARCGLERLQSQGTKVIYERPDTALARQLADCGVAPDLSFGGICEPDNRVAFAHRKQGDTDIYLIYNHSASERSELFTPREPFSYAEIWNPEMLTREPVCMAEKARAVRLELKPHSSLILVARH